MTKLSDLVAVDATEAPVAYGVEVDVESFSPPPGLKAVSLIYKADGADIDEALMDVIISYGLAGVDVTLEVPAEQSEIDAKYLVSVAANAGFSLSLLPPAARSEQADQAYFDRLRDFTAVYLTQANFGRFIAPVTNFIEYLFIEMLRQDTREFQTSDAYIQERFMPLVDQPFIDAFKARLREDIYGFFDGQEGFERFARRMLNQIHHFTAECAKDLVAQRQSSSAQGNDDDPKASAESDAPVN